MIISAEVIDKILEVKYVVYGQLVKNLYVYFNVENQENISNPELKKMDYGYASRQRGRRVTKREEDLIIVLTQRAPWVE